MNLLEPSVSDGETMESYLQSVLKWMKWRETEKQDKTMRFRSERGKQRDGILFILNGVISEAEGISRHLRSFHEELNLGSFWTTILQQENFIHAVWSLTPHPACLPDHTPPASSLDANFCPHKWLRLFQKTKLKRRTSFSSPRDS